MIETLLQLTSFLDVLTCSLLMFYNNCDWAQIIVIKLSMNDWSLPKCSEYFYNLKIKNNITYVIGTRVSFTLSSLNRIELRFNTNSLAPS